MKLYLVVLIAAVTVNCLITAIHGKTATDTLAIPYIDTLLPPFEDAQDKTNVTAITTTTTTTTTTKKPLTNKVNNGLSELSTEVLLPPLFEAKIEQEETKETKETTTKKTTTTTTTKTTTTTTRKPTTTTTTVKPTTTKTTLKPSKIKLPDLFLDSLLPPLFDNEVDSKNEAVTTQTTKKSYYQQQQQQQKTKDLHSNDQDKTQAKTYQKQVTAATNDRQVSESRTQTKQVSFISQQQKHVAQQVDGHKTKTNSNYEDKQYNYSFDSYFGSTTPRPIKSRLPTITPFPRRLRR